MPIYLPSYQGLTQSEALVEAAAYAPITRAMLSTYEIWHPSMSQPVRLVCNTEGITATLEAGAPRNASEAVAFTRCRVQASRPEEGGGGAGSEANLRIDNVSGFVADALRAARVADAALRDAPWEVIERVYASDDFSAPARLPVFKTTPVRVTIGGPVAIITAVVRRASNISVPAETFTPERYRGLLT